MRLPAGQSEFERLISVFEDDHIIYLVMEECTGGDLFDRICAKGRFSEPHAAHTFREMLTIVQKCHANGVIHRQVALAFFPLPSCSAPLKQTLCLRVPSFWPMQEPFPKQLCLLLSKG